MNKVRIKDKNFALSIPEEKLCQSIKAMAARMNEELKETTPLFVSVLNGSFMFTAELMKHVNIPCEISFVKLASYQGDTSTGVVTEALGLKEDIAGRTVVLLEDIIDTGLTMESLVNSLQAKKPACIKIATMLLKPDKLQADVKPDYVGMEIPNDFIVGFGLDYDGFGRNLPCIYSLCE